MQANTPSDIANAAPAGRLYWSLLALWALAFAGSFAMPALITVSTTGFAPGIGRVLWLSGLQCLASLLALVILVRGRGLAPGSTARRLRWLPAGLAMLVLAVMIAMTISADMR
ncbi:hypothetical protein [Pseudooceanicola nanhaiensis]|uniref:hypothetical protein n=1 Tax=Pseudooceanicola nanhaiensis TaxID=375761 RepID=UPI001CD6EDA4|nr:hypothetical protein [Pseudooceanicola nanhaiensis]MCA0918983.1 hypothetical protein [Pseudooceanicola nanhaiensis]